jgi:hypothetical protein
MAVTRLWGTPSSAFKAVIRFSGTPSTACILVTGATPETVRVRWLADAPAVKMAKMAAAMTDWFAFMTLPFYVGFGTDYSPDFRQDRRGWKCVHAPEGKVRRRDLSAKFRKWTPDRLASGRGCSLLA